MLYRFENQSLPIATGGFLYEMSVAVAEKLGAPYDLVIIPRGRIQQELLSGNLDLFCHASTGWNPPYKNQVDWSIPVYTYTDVFVGKKNIPFPQLEEMPVTTLGTVENFVYPELDKRFTNKTLFRDDAPSVAANVSKLLGGRFDFIIMNELEFPYFKIQHPQLQRSSFTIEKMDVRCALSRKSPVTLEKLNRTIEHLKIKNIPQKIYQRYMNPKTIPHPVIYALNNNDSPPFIRFDTSTEIPTVRGGIFFELALEVGKHMQRPLVFVLMPRSRLHSDLAEGTADFVCFDNEAWSGKFAKRYHWSVPIFRQSDHIISLKTLTGEAPVKNLNDLKGKVLGTTLNFVYPSLEPYFKNGTIIREDADSGLANVTKLNLKRLNFIVLNKLEFAYYHKTNPLLQMAPFDIDPINVKCAISKKSDLKLSHLNAAISAMKKNGRLDQVFAE